jgi:DNA-binding response OmpR family regulator
MDAAITTVGAHSESTDNMVDADNPHEPYVQLPDERVSARAPTRVFVAEDDPDMRSLIKQALIKDGYEVGEAVDGVDLLDMLQKALALPLMRPDVIVMDVIMPRHSGFGVLAALRRANWKTPVIMMSAIGEESICRKAKELGAAAFLKKPFDMDDLRTAVLSASMTRS